MEFNPSDKHGMFTVLQYEEHLSVVPVYPRTRRNWELGCTRHHYYDSTQFNRHVISSLSKLLPQFDYTYRMLFNSKTSCPNVCLKHKSLTASRSSSIGWNSATVYDCLC